MTDTNVTPVIPINSAQKVCAILRTLSSGKPMRLTSIAESATLNKVTALRILDTLCQEGFVRRLPASKLYALGPEALAIAVATREVPNIVQLARPSLTRLAVQSEDTVLFGIRSGVEIAYLDREVGSFPIQANYLHVGSRRPLGVGAGGLAMLAFLPDRDIQALLPLITPHLQRFPRFSIDNVMESVQSARKEGAAIVFDLLIERMGGIAMPVISREGEVMGAFSIVGLSERLETRKKELIEMLKREAQSVSDALAEAVGTIRRTASGRRAG
ncbi:HTH-type transcriptional regulator KipR [Variibacter gotjawalensis]|uniref:HTH-type transcriptional regulator KipR n=1 Tax=Variibacter gotjawalensis TaxID=1333996 RepID=A0A0S3PZH5_9BRAD|nr:IclR family transcriptional regulator [Variibacter gotjawalensis]NIK47191.1 DNA-binding IclR family transcriptional regulator [Variibacter gotjawalensis]RZS49091.1 IclR family transcriptional regulator [Variibacter gotjawalensis]BAT61353.1 HTH-type transcriptional regulator KipR [Variibacter gotjawalensis]